MQTSIAIYNSVKTLLNQKAFGNGFLAQKELDLTKGRNTNLFYYRGQFSPDFIANLIKYYATDDSVIFDPFVGSGTVLFEAARKNLKAHGTEINPAAFEMANTAIFANMGQGQRDKEVLKVLADITALRTSILDEKLHEHIEEKIKYTKNIYTSNILRNSYINLLRNKGPHDPELFALCIEKHARVINDLPFSDSAQIAAYLNDARNTPIKSSSVDLVITSPPYINVFNYHEHNRDFIDRIYGNTLTVAKSEIGANRKYRQNRFLTSIQYIKDMVQIFEEMRRVLKPSGRILLIIGRSSKIRGIDFRNDHIIAGVGTIAGFDLEANQERKFTNQYGETIYEEILHFKPSVNNNSDKMALASDFAAEILTTAAKLATKHDVKEDIRMAIENVSQINPSPLF